MTGDHPGPEDEQADRPGPSEPDDAVGHDDAGDADDADAPDDRPSGFDAWRRRSATGEVGTAIARGLAAVFAPGENRPVVSAPIPGDPPDPEHGFRVVLDPDDPSKSVAVFAPKDEDPKRPGEPASD